MKPTSSRGFTLIELMVVIAIIGVLSSVVLTSLTAAKNKANDAKRLTDIHAVQTALEMYANDKGAYPIVSAIASKCPGWGTDQGGGNVIPGLVPKYLPKMPDDPQMNIVNNTCCYFYRGSTGKDYKFGEINCSYNANYAGSRTLIDPARDGGGNSCKVDATTYNAWAVYTPNGCSY